jgi:hypothetical protein
MSRGKIHTLTRERDGLERNEGLPRGGMEGGSACPLCTSLHEPCWGSDSREEGVIQKRNEWWPRGRVEGGSACPLCASLHKCGASLQSIHLSHHWNFLTVCPLINMNNQPRIGCVQLDVKVCTYFMIVLHLLKEDQLGDHQANIKNIEKLTAQYVP